MASSQSFDHQRFLKTVTQKAGVYVMLSEAADILYVGKAKNLRNRLSSYFRSAGLTNKTMALVARIHQIEVTVTSTEREALLLEQNLIKQYRPPYNILLRDDKSYPYIYLSSDHRHPRLSLHRGSKRAKGTYFGPYPSAGAVRESLAAMSSLLPHIIKRCCAPATQREVALYEQMDIAAQDQEGMERAFAHAAALFGSQLSMGSRRCPEAVGHRLAEM